MNKILSYPFATMDLSDLTSMAGNPGLKPEMKIVSYSMEAKNASIEVLTVDDVVVGDLSANIVTLNDTPAVPNPPIGAVSFFSTGTELKATNPVGVTQTFATTANLANYLPLDGSSPMTGDLQMGAHNISTTALTASTETLRDTPAVANPPAGSVTFFSTGTQFKSTNPVGTTVTFATSADLAGYLKADGTVPMTGDLNLGFSGISTGAGVRFGGPATAATVASTAIGNSATASGAGGTAIGSNSVASANNCSAFGINANCSQVGGLAMGRAAAVSGGINGTAIGTNSVSSAQDAIAIGDAANASALKAIAIGPASANAVANTAVLGDAVLQNVRPGSNGVCDIGTSASQYKDLYLSGGVHGALSVASGYSTYADITVNNTVTDTDVATTASSVGSLLLPAGQPLGMVNNIFLSALATSAAGDTLTFRINVNGTTVLSHVLTIPALSVDLPIRIHTSSTVRAGTVYVCSEALVSAISNVIVVSGAAYDRTIANAWGVNAQWGANVNQLTVGEVYTTQFFRG